MVLIVGATGYIGRYLSIYLLEKGYSLLALGRSKKVQQFYQKMEYIVSILILMMRNVLMHFRRKM